MNNVMSNEYIEKKMKEINEEMIMRETMRHSLHPDFLALRHNEQMQQTQINLNLNFPMNNQF